MKFLVIDIIKKKIIESFATPGDFPSLIKLEISNPSNFENTVCSFALLSLKRFRLPKLVVKKEIDIKLPATLKINSEISLNFEDVKILRGFWVI